MKLLSVDGSCKRVSSTIRQLQLQCLPCDKPYNTSNGFWWVAYEGCEPVAFAGVVQSSQWIDAGYLCRSGVLPAYRGKGLQKRLIRARERKAREMGWNWLITDTRHNPASSNSLIACGYRLFIPSRPWGHSDAIYWRKEL